MKVSEALQSLIDNPDDLSSLPQLVAQTQTLENTEMDYQERISKLQDINKNYLSQIPIPEQKPEGKNEEDKEPTLEDAKSVLVKTLQGEN